MTLSALPIQSSASQTLSFGGATVAFGSTQNYSLQAGPANSDHGLTGINSSTVTLLSAIPGLLPGMSVEAKDSVGAAIFPAGTRVLTVSPDGLTVTVTQVAAAASDSSFGAVTTYAAQVGGGNRTTAVLPAGTGATIVPGTLVTGVNIPPGIKVLSVNVDTVTFTATRVGASGARNVVA